MTHIAELPDGLQLHRTTPTFDESTVPAGLRAAHRVAEGVWGRLVVLAGELDFVVEAAGDDEATTTNLQAGDAQVIPPRLLHHVELRGPVRFHVEFHR